MATAAATGRYKWGEGIGKESGPDAGSGAGRYLVGEKKIKILVKTFLKLQFF
jgi:hypothetical protein